MKAVRYKLSNLQAVKGKTAYLNCGTLTPAVANLLPIIIYNCGLNVRTDQVAINICEGGLLLRKRFNVLRMKAVDAVYNSCKCHLLTRTAMTLTVWGVVFRLTLWKNLKCL